VVPALEAALGHAGRFLSFQFLVFSFRLAKKGPASTWIRSMPGLHGVPRFAVSPRLHYIHVER
jgi:hypothetical protein